MAQQGAGDGGAEQKLTYSELLRHYSRRIPLMEMDIAGMLQEKSITDLVCQQLRIENDTLRTVYDAKVSQKEPEKVLNGGINRLHAAKLNLSSYLSTLESQNTQLAAELQAFKNGEKWPIDLMVMAYSDQELAEILQNKLKRSLDTLSREEDRPAERIVTICDLVHTIFDEFKRSENQRAQQQNSVKVNHAPERRLSNAVLFKPKNIMQRTQCELGLQEKFNLPSSEVLMGYWECSCVGVGSGVLHLTRSFLCYTINNNDWRIVIAVQDITQLDKLKNVKGLKKGIEISLADGQVFIFSHINGRTDCIRCIRAQAATLGIQLPKTQTKAPGQSGAATAAKRRESVAEEAPTWTFR